MYQRIFDFSIQTAKGGYEAYMTLYRWLIIRVFLLLGLPIVSVFALTAFFQSRYAAGVFMIGLAITILFLFLLLQSPISTKNRALLFEAIIRMFVFIFISYLLFETYIKGHYYIFPWYFVLPIMVFYALGVKEGFVWVTAVAAILIFTLFQGDVPLNDDLRTALNTRFVFVFIATSAFTSLVAFFAKTALKRLLKNRTTWWPPRTVCGSSIEDSEKKRPTERKSRCVWLKTRNRFAGFPTKPNNSAWPRLP